MEIPEGYKFKEIVYEDSKDASDELLQHLLSIQQDRSIPEGNKIVVNKQIQEILRIKAITMKPPKIILEREGDG